MYSGGRVVAPAGIESCMINREGITYRLYIDTVTSLEDTIRDSPIIIIESNEDRGHDT